MGLKQIRSPGPRDIDRVSIRTWLNLSASFLKYRHETLISRSITKQASSSPPNICRRQPLRYYPEPNKRIAKTAHFRTKYLGPAGPRDYGQASLSADDSNAYRGNVVDWARRSILGGLWGSSHSRYHAERWPTVGFWVQQEFLIGHSEC